MTESSSYEVRRSQIEVYFDRTAAEAWKRLTSTAPLGRIRASVRRGRDEHAGAPARFSARGPRRQARARRGLRHRRPVARACPPRRRGGRRRPGAEPHRPCARLLRGASRPGRRIDPLHRRRHDGPGPRALRSCRRDGLAAPLRARGCLRGALGVLHPAPRARSSSPSRRARRSLSRCTGLAGCCRRTTARRRSCPSKCAASARACRASYRRGIGGSGGRSRCAPASTRAGQ